MIGYLEAQTATKAKPESSMPGASASNPRLVQYRPEPLNPGYTIWVSVPVIDDNGGEGHSEWVKWLIDFHRHAARTEMEAKQSFAAAVGPYPLWLNLGSLFSLLALLASLVFGFIDGHVAVGFAALAFCGIWLFGNAAERFDRE